MIIKFKIFEGFWGYEEEDYILYKNVYVSNFVEEYKKGKIISINKNANFPIKIKNSDNEINFIQPDKIIRKLKEKEIKDFEINIQSKKYNL